ncbi:MAG: AraC family transcriptional regulator [Gammaproteobacteria bacterium]|nr:AraC family transcriptional regulator [Gammaproteobacteria bacterium]
MASVSTSHAQVGSARRATVIAREPHRSLRPFISEIWTSADKPSQTNAPARRELVLPTGTAHIAIRLDDRPIHLFDNPSDQSGNAYPAAVVGGIRDEPYYKFAHAGGPSVGITLCAGAAELMTRAPASVFAGHHSALEDVWGRSAVSELTHELCCATTAQDRLARLERFLIRRLPESSTVHPAVSLALARFSARAAVTDVVRETGFSHRHFIRVFERAVGLTPKNYLRLLRFNEALDVARRVGVTWADVAATAGYADQSHFNREFLAFASLTPTKYRQLYTSSKHHIPMAEGQFRSR